MVHDETDAQDGPTSSPLSCSPAASVSSSASLFGLGVELRDGAATPLGAAATRLHPCKLQEAPPDDTQQPLRRTSTSRPSKLPATGSDGEPFNPERYLLWHKRALLQRTRVGNGRSHEMHRLYAFWVSFLQDGFNEPMYASFRRYAEEDASAGHTHGLSCLFAFYHTYLTAGFDAELYKDFESLALKYHDYLDFTEGMERLCQLLVGGHVPRPPVGVAVDPRTLEYLAGWRAGREGSDAPDGCSDGAAGPLSSSLTGSSDAGEHVMAAGLARARYWSHAGGRGPHPASHREAAIGCSPSMDGARWMARSLSGASPVAVGPAELVPRVGSAPGAGLPTSARIKRSKHRGSAGGKRGGLGPAGGAASGGQPAQPGPGSGRAARAGSSRKSAEAHLAPTAPKAPPPWEAQPCRASCKAAAELALALPARLGELFGD